jgi:hypothetical protein
VILGLEYEKHIMPMSIEAEQFTVSDTSACNPNVSGRRQYHRCPILLHLGFAFEKNIMPRFLNAE